MVFLLAGEPARWSSRIRAGGAAVRPGRARRR